MRVLKGTAVSPGIVRGIICLYADETDGQVPHYSVLDDRIEMEVSRLHEALAKAGTTIRHLVTMSKKLADSKALEIMNAHLLILEDKGLIDKVTGLIRHKKINAEHAVSDIFDEYIRFYAGKKMHFAELAHDFTDLKNRVLSSFGTEAGHFTCPTGERQPVVVAAQRLTPSMVLNIPHEHVLAFLTDEGGFTTHATILARSLDIPVIFGIPIKETMECSTPVIVDGFSGQVFLDPDQKTIELYEKKGADYHKKKTICELKKELPVQTRNRIKVQLKLNISTPAELDVVGDMYHDGVGLLRTEFLFLDRETPPTEAEQVELYTRLAKQVHPRPMVVRLLDIGSDKLPSFFKLPEQKNPDLEIKGARAVEFFYDVYLTQVKALLQAGKQGNIRLLYPMVSDAGDVLIYKELVTRARTMLEVEKKVFAATIQDGIMIETPAAALLADQLLSIVSFANIGSNDLLQYTLAASRGNQLVEQRYHILHPALIKLFEMIVKAGKKHRKEICLCGEVSSFDEFYPLFLHIGLRTFSVAVAQYSRIKCELLHTQGRLGKKFMRSIYAAKTKHELDNIFTKPE